MKVQGTIIALPKEERGASMATGKEWRKRFVIIETSEQYPKKICFALWNENIDKCAQQLEMGNQITAHVDIESREYNGRWYTEARAWRVDSQGVAHQAQQGYYPPQQQQGGYQAPAPQEPAGDIYLPF